MKKGTLEGTLFGKTTKCDDVGLPTNDDDCVDKKESWPSTGRATGSMVRTTASGRRRRACDGSLKKRSKDWWAKQPDEAVEDLALRGGERPGRARLHGKRSEEAVILSGQMQQREKSLQEKKGCRRSLHVDQLMPTGARNLAKVPERADFGDGDAGDAAHKQAQRRRRSYRYHDTCQRRSPCTRVGRVAGDGGFRGRQHEHRGGGAHLGQPRPEGGPLERLGEGERLRTLRGVGGG